MRTVAESTARTFSLATAPPAQPARPTSPNSVASISPPDESARVAVTPLKGSPNRSSQNAAESLSRAALSNDATNFTFLVRQRRATKQRGDFDSDAAFEAWTRTMLGHPLAAPCPSDQDYVLVTLTAIRADQLKAKDKNGASNPYIVMAYQSDSQGLVFQSDTIEKTLSPEWNMRVTLLIRDSPDPVTFSIWNKRSTPVKESFLDLRSAATKNKHPDAFLGIVSIPGATLIQLIQQQSTNLLERWFNLDKRSRNSHVSGRLLLAIEDPLKDHLIPQQELFDQIFDCIPPEPISAFHSVLKQCLESDYKSNTASTKYLLSEHNLDLTEMLAKHWFIDSCTRAVIELECYKEIYEAELINGRTFFSLYYEIVKDIENAYRSNQISKFELTKFQTLGVQIHALVLTHISTFFDQPIETYSPVSPKELNFFIQTYQSLTSNPLLAPLLSSKPSTALTTTQLLDGYISESLAIRYHSFVIEKDGSAAEDEGAALEMLATGVLEELRVFSEVFDGLILEKFHIPTIAARIYIEGLALRIEEYVSSLMSSTAQVIPLDTGFKVYSIAKELVGVCEKIDYRLVERLKIQTWFRPFLEEFVGISESKINEWVHNAVLVDDFSLFNTGHSSSVLDIFVSFQQQLEFILKLEWPSQHDTAMFIGKLIENIGEGIEKYALLMKQSISSDLKAAPTHTKANSNTSQQPLATSPYKLKLKVRKQGPPIDPSELRVSPKSCVKLSNIEFLLSRFNELMETVPREYKETWRSSTESLTVPSNPPPTVTSPLKPIRRNTRKAVAQMRPRVAGTLSILHTLDLHPVRPFATEVSIRICTMPSGRETRNNLGDGNSARPSIGRELGRTQKMHQSKKIVFMEESARGTGSSAEIPILLTDMDIERGLQLLIVHHVPVTVGASASASPGSAGGTYAGNEYLIAMEGFAMDHVVMTAVKSGAAGVIFGVSVYGGMVMLRLVIQQGVVVNIVKERLGYVVGRTVEESTRIIVDKLCYDLRQRLKDASAGHKQSVIIANNILNLFSSESTKKKLQTPLSSSEKPTETEVDTKLAPLLDFIDANLSIIAATIISVPLANRVVQGIWERFIDVADGLVVPNLGDDNGLLDKKKQWEESRVAFLGHTVGIVKDFLHADGNGLPLAQMEIESLGQLELTLLHYSWGRKELWQKHLSEMSRFMNWSDAWLLKLIKLKGGYGDYVVEAMRRKVEGIY